MNKLNELYSTQECMFGLKVHELIYLDIWNKNISQQADRHTALTYYHLTESQSPDVMSRLASDPLILCNALEYLFEVSTLYNTCH